MGMHIIVSGSISGGFKFYGPYNNATEAVEAAAGFFEFAADQWWVAPLNALGD